MAFSLITFDPYGKVKIFDQVEIFFKDYV